MSLPPEQRRLYEDLTHKADLCADQDSLIHLMGDVLRSLLRRKGDQQFLGAVQDLFIDGLTGLAWPEQKVLAAEVIALVISKRPEIAIAWQRLHPDQGHDGARRAADTTPTVSAKPSDGLPDFDLLGADFAYMFDEDNSHPPPQPSPDDLVVPGGDAYEYGLAERNVVSYVADVLDRRLSIFAIPELKFPSLAYCHEQPFFLFSPVYAKVTRRFLAWILMPLMRDPLERHVYRQAQPAILRDEKKLDAFLAEKRPDIWKIIAERLGKLATHHRLAESKLAAAQNSSGSEPEFQVVEVPVKRPRVLRVLGVPVTLGTKSTLAKKKVRVRPSTVPDAHELQALGLITEYRDMAAQGGLDLPGDCDFAFLRTLLEFDAKRYAQTLSELGKLAQHKETTRNYLLDRLRGVDETYSTHMADALTITLFYHGTGGQFGFRELYDVCVGSAGNASAMASKRPFLPMEVGRRPRELAFQVRECLKRRVDRSSLGLAISQLFEVWKGMARNRFQSEMDAALTVFSALPVVFAGDPAESQLSQIGIIVQQALASDKPDAGRTIDQVLKIYGPLAGKKVG